MRLDPSRCVPALLLCCSFPASAIAGTIKVPQDQPTINDAIAAASPGDVIEIAKGTYPESVIVSTPDLTLVGKGKVIIDAGGIGSGIIVGAVSGVELRRLQIQNTVFAGILLSGSTSCLVEDCKVSSSQAHGIAISNGVGNDLIDNEVRDVGDRGLLVQGSQNLIEENEVDGAEICLLIEGVSNVVEENEFSGALDDVVDVNVGSSNLLIDNQVEDGTNDGFEVDGPGNVLIGNTIRNAGTDGIELGDDGNVAHDNEIEDVVSDGFEIVGSNNDVSWNEVDDPDGDGIFTSGVGNVLHRNDVAGAGNDGIGLNGADCLVSFNKLRKSGNLDIEDAGTDNVFIKNDFKTSNLP